MQPEWFKSKALKEDRRVLYFFINCRQIYIKPLVIQYQCNMIFDKWIHYYHRYDCMYHSVIQNGMGIGYWLYTVNISVCISYQRVPSAVPAAGDEPSAFCLRLTSVYAWWCNISDIFSLGHGQNPALRQDGFYCLTFTFKNKLVISSSFPFQRHACG